MRTVGRDRREHQPVLGLEGHERYVTEQQRAICGDALALILVDDWNTTPLTVLFDEPDREPYVCDGRDGDREARAVKLPRPLQLFEGKTLLEHAVKLASSSGFAKVAALLCDPGEHEAAACAVLGEDVEVRVVSKAEANAARERLAGFELAGVSSMAITVAGDMLTGNPEAGRVVFLGVNEPRLTPWHVAQLCLRRRERPACDVVFSWIVWLRRLPVLVTRGFFDTAREQGLFHAREGSHYRPLPQLDVEEVVFGEEKLAGNESSRESRDRFLADAPISALEAVRLARKLAKADSKEAKSLKRPLSKASLELLGLACEVVTKMDASLSETEAAKLARWDKWGRRNKRDFAIFSRRDAADSLVYLDNAATSQRLLAAVEAEADFNNHANANIYRGSYKLSAAATATFNDARAVVERHLNAKRRQTVLTANTTDAVNKAAQSWALRNLQEDDLVLIVLSEHHSNMLPWRLAAEARGARVAYIPLCGDGRIDMDAYRAMLEQRPRLVCIAQISNTMGLVNPVREMAAAAHEVGARIFVDAAQSFPHLSIDVAELGCDFLAFSGHKAYGPFGIGGLWISEETFAEMDPTVSGGGAISHVGRDSYYLRAGAIQYEIGTPPIAQAVGLARAVEYLDTLGMDAVGAHGAALTAYLLRGLDLLADITVWGERAPQDGVAGLVSFNLAGTSSARIANDLGALGVCIRAGGQCALPLHAAMGVDGSARISLGVYNTAEDVEAAVVAVAMCNRLAGSDNVFRS